MVNRSRSELVPPGIAIGSFFIYPKLSFTGASSDNIYATEKFVKEDYISFISPELSVQSNWNNHALNLKISSEIGRYLNFDTEDFENRELAIDGQFKAARNILIDGGVTTGQYHVPRFSPNDAGGLEPTIYTKRKLFARYDHQFGRFSFLLDADFSKRDYDDVPGIRNSQQVIVNQDDRDRDQQTVQLRGGYELLSGYEVFIRVQKNRRDYANLQDITNFNRSSNGYEIVVGSEFDFDGIIFGDLFAGIREQRYRGTLPDINSPAFGALLNWNLTKLTTAKFNLEHLIMETTSPLFSAYRSTSAGIMVDHEFLRNCLLNTSIKMIDNHYEGIGSAKRDDSILEVKVGATYMINRHLYASVQYFYLKRDGTDNTIAVDNSHNFKRNLLYFQLQTQL